MRIRKQKRTHFGGHYRGGPWASLPTKSPILLSPMQTIHLYHRVCRKWHRKAPPTLTARHCCQRWGTAMAIPAACLAFHCRESGNFVRVATANTSSDRRSCLFQMKSGGAPRPAFENTCILHRGGMLLAWILTGMLHPEQWPPCPPPASHLVPFLSGCSVAVAVLNQKGLHTTGNHPVNYQ